MKMNPCSEILLRSQADIIKFINSLADGTKYSNLGDLTRVEYLENVFRFLNTLKPKQSVTIDKIVKPENKEFYMQCVCLYIIETGTDTLEFSNDFKRIIKR